MHDKWDCTRDRIYWLKDPQQDYENTQNRSSKAADSDTQWTRKEKIFV